MRAAVAAGSRRRCCWSSLARAPASCRAPAAREGRSRPSAQWGAAASGIRPALQPRRSQRRLNRPGRPQQLCARIGRSDAIGGDSKLRLPGPATFGEGGEADAVAPFEAHLHVAHVRPRLAQRGRQPTSAEHFVGARGHLARGHLVDEHDDARCARRAAWLRSCAICPTSWRRLAYVSSVFARTWNAIESTTTRRTHRPGRPGALFACPCAPATSRKRDVQASPPIAHGDGVSVGPNDENN